MGSDRREVNGISEKVLETPKKMKSGKSAVLDGIGEVKVKFTLKIT